MPLNLTGKSVLVVDDDPDILIAIKASLADSGADVQTATDGNTAATLLQKSTPDLIILDVMLPQKSGFLVLQQMRQKIPSGQGPKIIMITGNQGQRHRQFAQALGVNEYLQKPFRMERLTEAIDKLFPA